MTHHLNTITRRLLMLALQSFAPLGGYAVPGLGLDV
jgi:hypothetical protein